MHSGERAGGGSMAVVIAVSDFFLLVLLSAHNYFLLSPMCWIFSSSCQFKWSCWLFFSLRESVSILEKYKFDQCII